MNHREYLYVAILALVVMLAFDIAFAGGVSLQPANVNKPYASVNPPQPITLNTVDYAISVIHDKVLIPDANRVGPNYTIIGVMIMLKPQFDTTNNGITWRHWGLDFYISDKPFVNGTTLDTELTGHLIRVSEASSTGYGNSHDAAASFIAPSQLCQYNVNSKQQTCTEVPGNGGQLVQLRNTYLAVHPEVPYADFTIDGVNRGFGISGDLTYQQVLALADSMIP